MSRIRSFRYAWLASVLGLTALVVAACAEKFPTLDEQRSQVRNGQLPLHRLTSQALIDVWGNAAYTHREYMQYFTLEGGASVPFFRVPLGEAPREWDNGIVSGESLFLGYPDRGEFLAFLNDRLVYRERLPAEEIHTMGKSWEKESAFKTQLEKAVRPPMGSVR